MKAPLILFVSEKMSSNKKNDRNEDSLIRLGETARNNLGLSDEKTVEVWPDTDIEGRIHRSRGLTIFQAYASDLKKAKSSMSEDDFVRVGFVTQTVFNCICSDGRRKKQDIWLADSIEDTIVGGDPEFVLLKEDGRIKYAAEIEGFSYSAILGSDGPLAELRPDPTIKVDDFVNNIQTILQTHPNAELIDSYEWTGGCYFGNEQADCQREHAERDWPVGGHIHLGTPAQLAVKLGNGGLDYKSAVYGCLQHILDELVAIPLIRIDGVQKSRDRRNSNYGKYGDFKTGHGRLEYRTISGEWLTHPDLARMIIGTVKAISDSYFKMLEQGDFDPKMVMTTSMKRIGSGDEYGGFNYRLFHNNDNFKGWEDIEITKMFGTTRSSHTMRNILDKVNIEFTDAYFKKLSAKYRALPAYREYAEYIEKLLEVVQLPDEVLEGRSRNLKSAWVDGENFII